MEIDLVHAPLRLDLVNAPQLIYLCSTSTSSSYTNFTETDEMISIENQL